MSEEKRPRNAMPWDLLNPNTKYVPEEIYSSRFDVCQSCEHLMSITNICKKCGCFMKTKCAMGHAYCPEGKWFAYQDPSESQE